MLSHEITETDRRLAEYIKSVGDHRIPERSRTLPEDLRIASEWIAFSTTEVIDRVLSLDPDSDKTWRTFCTNLTDAVLFAVASEGSLETEWIPAGIHPVAIANGGMVRNRYGVGQRFLEVSMAARYALSREERFLSADPMVLRALDKLALGPFDFDVRLVIGDCNPREVITQLQKNLNQYYISGFSDTGRPLSEAGNRAIWQAFVGEEPVQVSVELFPLDTGSYRLAICARDSYQKWGSYTIDVTLYPTRAMLVRDCRSGLKQSLRMGDQVLLAIDRREVSACPEFIFLERLDHWNDINLARSVPEQIIDTDYDSLAQAVIAVLRMSRGMVLDDRVHGKLLSFPAHELVDPSLIPRLRSQFLALLTRQRALGEPISEVRALDILSDVILCVSMHPAIVKLWCATGLIDVFVPGAGTLISGYDYRENPFAEQLIKAMRGKRHIEWYIQELFERQNPSLGINILTAALHRLKLINSPTAIPAIFNLSKRKW